MKGKTTNPTKHAHCATSGTPFLPACFLPLFAFNVIIVRMAAINSVCVAVNSTSSLMVDECETSILIPDAINSVNDSIFSTTETILDGTPTITSGAQIVVSGMETIICTTDIVLSKLNTIISAFLPGSFAAPIVISAAQKTAGANLVANIGAGLSASISRDGRPFLLVTSRETTESPLTVLLNWTSALKQ